MFGPPKQFGANPFGQQQTTAQPAFGQPANAFGKPPAFGQQNSTSLFGATAPATGIFGQTAAPAFGSTAAPTFGQTAPTQSAFGSFGQTQPTSTSLFGQTSNTQANTSLFGQPSTSGFGAAKAPGFGGFGGGQQSTSLFGQVANPMNTGFGGSTFGSPSTSAFGQPQPALGANGTAIAKYQPHAGTDTLVKNGQTNSVSTRQHCITAMKEYEGKSLEELRLEDYMANRKGPQAGTVPQSGGLFGGAAPSTGLFGAPASQPQSTGLFGQQTTTNTMGGFGQSPNTSFGQPSAFGQTQPAAQNSLFGKPTTGFGQTQSAFGQPQTTAPNNLFGKPFAAVATSANTGFAGFGTNTAINATSPFGAAKPFGQTTAGGLFGQTAPTSTAGFGQQPSAFGGFGSTAPAATSQPNSLFTNTGGSLFNGLTSSAPSTVGFGGFGTTTNTANGGLFGQKPATGFGAPTFGVPASSAAPAFGGFGNTTSAFGSFGQTNAMKPPAMAGFTGFGAPQGTSNLTGGLSMGNNMTGFGTMNTQAQQPQQMALPIHQHILSLTTSPYGDNPIFKDLKPLSRSNEDALKPTNPAAQKAILEASSNNYKISPKVGGTGMKLKPVGSTVSKKSLFGGLEEFDSSVDESFSLKSNAKRLVIKPKVPSAQSSAQNQANRSLQLSDSQGLRSSLSNDSPRQGQVQISSLPESEMTRRVSWLHSNLEKVSEQNRNADALANNTIQELVPSSKATKSKLDVADSNRSGQKDDNNAKSGSLNDSLLANKSYLDETIPEFVQIDTEPHPTGIILKRPGYYTIPSLDELVDYIGPDGSCVVPNFTIGRKGYGNVYYDGPIDIAGMNLDDLVHFRHKEVIIYPDDENKPPLGQGLNRKAQVTLDQVWPHDKTLHEPIKDRERLELMNYEGKLRSICDKHDTRFVEYRPESGSWVFKVDHWSKYGLTESDEEDNATESKKPKTQGVNDIRKGAHAPQGAISKMIIAQSKEASTSRAIRDHGLGGGVVAPIDNDFEDSNSFDSEMNLNRFATTTSPSAEIAKSMNTDSHKLQLMKASLFIDEEYDNKSVISDRYGGRDSPDQIVPSKKQFTFSLSSHSMLSKEVSSPSSIDTPAQSPTFAPRRDIDFTRKHDDIIPEENLFHATTLKPSTLIVQPKVALVRAADTSVALEDSILTATSGQNILADVALYNGRRFNVGWAHSNQFTILADDTNAGAGLFNARMHLKPFVKQMKIFSLDQMESKSFHRSVLGHLECRLKYIEKKFERNSDCPYFEVKGGANALQNHYEVAVQNSQFNDFDKFCVTVWSLCVALWGEQEDLENINQDDHVAIMLRQELFSKWLEDVVGETDLLEGNVNDIDYLDHMWKLLTVHRIQDACELAFEKNDINLSLLLAQAGSSNVVRALISMQLESWRVTEADKFIAANRLKAMMLIGAIPTLETSNGELNIYDKLDWLKSIALTIWYICSPTASITDALLKYDEATEHLAKMPTPPYQANYDVTSPNSTSEQLQDIRYHILKLYSRRSHSMERLLNSATHTSDIMDFRLSWQLLQVLKGLGYGHCSKQSEIHLSVSFASQLENYGLWQWSIFVLLHIQDQNKRELSVQELLYRYVDLSQNEEYQSKENFVINVLGVPEKWVNWAKAVRAGAMRKYHAQADYLLKAKQWPLAHEIIMDHIAPDAIINGNSRYLKDLLDRFEDPRHVPSWSNQGMILLDYLDITTKFETLKTIHERDIETRWEGLKPQLSELCSRINLFPCPTAKHRLCQSEIAQGLAILVNGMEILSSEINPCVMLKKSLEKLPLPEEFAKQKIRALLENNSFIEMLQTD